MGALLKWDQTGERFYETGIKNCGLYPYTDGEYKPGVAWNGITSVTESPSGADESALYADDTKYLSLRSTEELGGTVEAYTYPDAWAACDGTAKLETGVSIGQQTRKMFGLSYQTTLGNDVDGNDLGYKLHLLYGATASPSQRAYQTINDSPEAITFSWEFTTTPVSVGDDYKKSSLLTIDSTKADSTALKLLETILRGLEAGDSDNLTGAALPARLPLPEEVLAILAKTQTSDPKNVAPVGAP